MTKKMDQSKYLSGGQYSDNKNIRFKTPMLWSDLCYFSDVYIVVKERLCVTGTNNAVLTEGIKS